MNPIQNWNHLHRLVDSDELSYLYMLDECSDSSHVSREETSNDFNESLCTNTVCNKRGAVKIKEKENGLSFPRLCPLAPSLNIKDTAGCSVLIKQVSVHKQLIDKSAPPLSRCVCLSFPFYDRSGLHPAPWIATSVYYAHGGGSDRHNDTIVTLPHMPRSLLCDPKVSWHISGTDSVFGNNRTCFFLNNSCSPVRDGGCDVITRMLYVLI